MKTTRRSLAALAALPLALLAFPALGDVAPDMSGAPRLAIGGYDHSGLPHDGQSRSRKNLNIRRSGTRHAGNSPARRISTCLPKILKNTQPNMTGIAPWASHMGMVHKDTVDPEAFTIVNDKTVYQPYEILDDPVAQR